MRNAESVLETLARVANLVHDGGMTGSHDGELRFLFALLELDVDHGQ